uniref:Enkurin, TRPC channel interacting protein n=2 Tax=Mola mola TaxID=94237 RepID=A0A3Q3VR58_MOLML
MSEVVHPPESIYNLLPKQEVHISKPSRYVSKYRSAVVLETKANKDPMRTMGPAKVEVPSPDKYLRKHSKEPRSPDKMQISQRHACTVKKPPVPARTDNPPMGIHTKKNFIRTAIFVTVKPKPAIVDTNKGHKQLLDNSGLAPKYTKKKASLENDKMLTALNTREGRQAGHTWNTWNKSHLFIDASSGFDFILLKVQSEHTV